MQMTQRKCACSHAKTLLWFCRTLLFYLQTVWMISVVPALQSVPDFSSEALNASAVCNGTLSLTSPNAKVVFIDAKTSTSPIQFVLSKRFYEHGKPFRVALSTQLTNGSSRAVINSFLIQAHRVDSEAIVGKFLSRFSDSDISIHTCGNDSRLGTAAALHKKFRPRYLVTAYWLPPFKFWNSVRFHANVQLSTNETWRGLLSFEVVPKVQECLIGNGDEYRGTVHTTVSGIECQRWDANIPHKHYTTPEHYPNDDLLSNFCRNMDNDTTPWCYTTNSSKRFEKCLIPKCVANFPDYFYPFGLSEGDFALHNDKTLSESNEMVVSLRTKLANLTSFRVAGNGLIIFNNKREINNLKPRKFPLSRRSTSLLPNVMAIAGFWTDTNRSTFNPTSSLVFYRQSVDADLLTHTTGDIKTLSSRAINKNYSIEGFEAKFAIVTTWYLMKDNPQTKGNSFQVILTGDDKYTFIVMNYALKEWSSSTLAQIGYDFGNGESINVGRDSFSFAADFSPYVTERSNVGVAGRWLLDISPPCSCSGNASKITFPPPSQRSSGTDDRLTDQSATTKGGRSHSDKDFIVQTGPPVDNCRESPCNNGGTCETKRDKYACNCLPGFTGHTCSNNINECISQPCKNGGSCIDLINRYSCSCTNGFTGYNCETNIETCLNNVGVCKNGGECRDQQDGYICLCDNGYEGKTCNIGVCIDGKCSSPKPCLYLLTMKTNCTCTEKSSRLCISHVANTTITGHYCPMERSGNASHGYINWKETKAGSVTSVPCPFPSKQNASRQCNLPIYGGWAEPDFSNCLPLSQTSLLLQQLFLGVITSENASVILNQVAQLTNLSSAALNAYDLGNIAMILQRGVDVIQVMNRSTAKDVLLATSNILLSSKEERRVAGQVSSSNALFIQNVETTTLKLNSNNMNWETFAEVTSPAINIAVTKTSNVTEDISFVLSNKLETELIFGARNNNVKASITLPSSLLKSASSNNSVQFVAFKMSNLFEFSSKSSIRPPHPQSRLVASDLVLNGAVGTTSVANLSDPVLISFTHHEASNLYCVFWKPPGKDETEGSWSTDGCSVTQTSTTTTTCECGHLTNFAVLLDIYNTQGTINDKHDFILRVLTYLGCGMSILGLAFTLLSYVLFGKLKKDIPSKILASLCVALIGVNLFFLALQPSYFNSPGCTAVAVCLHYFLLCSMMWMGLEALNMYIALIRVFNAYYRKYLIKLSVAGWGIPFLFVAVALGLHFAVEPSYIQREQLQICWLRPGVLYGTLVAPFGVIFIFNCIIFCLVLGQLLGINSQRTLSKRDSRRSKKTAKGENVRKFRGAVGLLALLGITWGLAFVAIGEAHLFFSYAFVVFNSSQGFWVFIFHCLLKKEICRGWKHLFQGKKLRDLRSSSKQWTRRNSDNSSASTRGSRSTPVASRTVSTASIKADSEDSNHLPKSSLHLDVKTSDSSNKHAWSMPAAIDLQKINALNALPSTALPTAKEIAAKRLVRRIPRPVIAPPSVSVAVQTDPTTPQKKKLQKSLSTGTGIGEKYRIISSDNFSLELTEKTRTIFSQESNYKSLHKSIDNANLRISTSSSNESGIYSDNLSGKSIENISDDKAFEGGGGVLPTDEQSITSSPSCTSSNSGDQPNTSSAFIDEETKKEIEVEAPTTWIPPLVIKRADNECKNQSKKMFNIRTKSQPLLGQTSKEEKIAPITVRLEDFSKLGEGGCLLQDSAIASKNNSVTGTNEFIRMTKFRINRGSFHDSCP